MYFKINNVFYKAHEKDINIYHLVKNTSFKIVPYVCKKTGVLKSYNLIPNLPTKIYIGIVFTPN